jgi:hypothetical protein
MLKKYGEIFTVILAMILLMFFLCSCGPKGSETIAQTSEEESATESTETENTENYGDVPKESGIDGETQEEPFEEEEEEATEEEQEEEEEHPYPEFFEIRLLTGLGARYFEGAWDELLIEEKVRAFEKRVWNYEIKDFNAAWDTYMAELYEAGLGSIVEKYYNSLEFPSYTLPDFNSTIRSFKGLK